MYVLSCIACMARRFLINNESIYSGRSRRRIRGVRITCNCDYGRGGGGIWERSTLMEKSFKSVSESKFEPSPTKSPLALCCRQSCGCCSCHVRSRHSLFVVTHMFCLFFFTAVSYRYPVILFIFCGNIRTI